MNEYRFDLSNFTIADMCEVTQAAQTNDVHAIIRIANRFIPINLFALPFGETPIVVECFYQALKTLVPDAAPDPIDQLIRKALEDV